MDKAFLKNKEWVHRMINVKCDGNGNSNFSTEGQ